MKEKKTWEKRVLSIVLAFAMVLTQFGVWNAGKESVQAAENDNFTLYYYCEDAEELYVNIWSWKALKFAEGETFCTNARTLPVEDSEVLLSPGQLHPPPTHRYYYHIPFHPFQRCRYDRHVKFFQDIPA